MVPLISVPFQTHKADQQALVGLSPINGRTAPGHPILLSESILSTQNITIQNPKRHLILSPRPSTIAAIRAENGVNARQWQYLADWSVNRKSSSMSFAGVTTQRQACEDQ